MAKKEDKKFKREKKTLLRKLHLVHDQSINRELHEGHSVSYFLASMRGRYSKVILINIMLAICFIPGFVLILSQLPKWEGIATQYFDFASGFGTGYIGGFNVESLANIAIYEERMKLFLYLIACFPLLGVGASGAFYCARNMLWDTEMKISVHFWRGVKNYWWIFLIVFTLIGAVVGGTGYSMFSLMVAQEQGTANAGDWCFVVFMFIAAILLFMFSMYFLPHVVAYKMPFKYHLKNTFIFMWSMLPISIINMIGMCLPFLTMFSSFMGTIIMIAFMLLGMMFYVVWISAVGHYGFDNFIERSILYQVEMEQKQMAIEKREERKKQGKKEQENYVKSYKNKKKK